MRSYFLPGINGHSVWFDGGAGGGKSSRMVNETGETDEERAGQRLRGRKWKRSQEFSHTNPFGRELQVNYSSFVFYLATAVWEWGSSKASQALIDAVWPEGFTQFWRWDHRRGGSEGVMVSGIGVAWRSAALYCPKSGMRWTRRVCFKRRKACLALWQSRLELEGLSSCSAFWTRDCSNIGHSCRRWTV